MIEVESLSIRVIVAHDSLSFVSFAESIRSSIYPLSVYSVRRGPLADTSSSFTCILLLSSQRLNLRVRCCKGVSPRGGDSTDEIPKPLCRRTETLERNSIVRGQNKNLNISPHHRVHPISVGGHVVVL